MTSAGWTCQRVPETWEPSEYVTRDGGPTTGTLASRSGRDVRSIPTGESSNCTFGGEGRKTLYVTSRSVFAENWPIVNTWIGAS